MDFDVISFDDNVNEGQSSGALIQPQPHSPIQIKLWVKHQAGMEDMGINVTPNFFSSVFTLPHFNDSTTESFTL